MTHVDVVVAGLTANSKWGGIPTGPPGVAGDANPGHTHDEIPRLTCLCPGNQTFLAFVREDNQINAADRIGGDTEETNIMTVQSRSDTTVLETHRTVPTIGLRIGSALLAVLVAGALVVACGGGDGEESTDQPAGDATSAPLELSLGESDAMASCLPVDAATLSQMAPAFEGTVTGIEGETITLDVDTWYAGAEQADAVELHAQQGLEALIGGIDFQVGEQYLITAADGSVNYCGYSGPADPTLTALFDEAFGA